MLRTSMKMASLPKELIGATGRRYRFEEILQERRRLGRVWTAMFDFLSTLSTVLSIETVLGLDRINLS